MALEVQVKIKLKKIKYIFLLLVITAFFTGCGRYSFKQNKLINMAIKDMDNQEYEIAIQKFEEALLLNTKNIDLKEKILLNKSLCELKINQYDKALESLKNMDEQADDRVKALKLILLSRQAKDMDKAYKLLLDLSKNNTYSKFYKVAVDEFLSSMMLIKYKNNSINNFDLASIKELNEKEYLKEKTVNNANNMAIFEFLEENYDKALEYLEEARELSLKSNNKNLYKDILFNMAICYEYKLEPKEAIKLFEEYLDKYGENDTIIHEIKFLKSRLKE